MTLLRYLPLMFRCYGRFSINATTDEETPRRELSPENKKKLRHSELGVLASPMAWAGFDRNLFRRGGRTLFEEVRQRSGRASEFAPSFDNSWTAAPRDFEAAVPIN